MKTNRLNALLNKAIHTGIVLLVMLITMNERSLAQNQQVNAPRVAIKGNVTDKDNTPLIGVTVAIKGSPPSATTDVNGDFTINVAAVPAALVFRYLGYSNKEMSIKNTSKLLVILEENRVALDEVVVVGYGTQTKGTITGAVTNLKSEDLVRTPAPTVSGALVGKIPGVTTRQAVAEPGNGVTVQIRNMGSPLFVVDGVPVNEGSFNNLSNDDIDEISILKDGSAAIYGFRAANGVVLVTTKQGKRNSKPTIQVSSYYGLQDFTRFPHPSNLYQYIRASAESDQNLSVAVPRYNAAELEKYRLATDPAYQGIDYYEYNTKNSVPQYNLNVSASGGSQTTKYSLSVSNFNQKGILDDFNFGRTNLGANLEVGLTKGLKVGTQIQARKEMRHQPGTPQNSFDYPFIGVFRMIPNERPYANNNPNYINGNVRNLSYNPATFNEDVVGYEDNDWYNLRSNLYAQYDLPFGLTAKGTYSYGYSFNKYDSYNYTYDAYDYDAATDTYPVKGGLTVGARSSVRNYIIDRFMQFQLTYNKKLGDHSLAAVAAYEWQDQSNQSTTINGVPPHNYSEVLGLSDQITAINYSLSPLVRAGVIGRLNYNYKQKYLLELLGRYDGSYLYPPGKRWGLFPGVSAGWRISEEPFIKKHFGFFNNLKLRASYGQTGREDATAFSFLGGGTYRSGNYVFGTNLINGTDPRNPPVTNLTWTTSTSKNIGIDFAILKNRLSGEFDVFERKLTGVPAGRNDILLPNETGYSLPNENLNSEANRGIEGILRWQSKIGKVDYSISGNATLSRRKVLELYNPRYGNSVDEYLNRGAYRWGNVTRGYQVTGRFQSQEEIDNYPVDNDGQGNKTQLPGDFIFKDVNGDGIINGSDDDEPIAYSRGNNPIMGYGMSGSVGYKAFTLSFDFSGGTMFSFERNFEMKIPFQANGNSPNYMFEDRWHREDPFDPNSKWIAGEYPAVRQNANHVNYSRLSNYWVTNTTFFRMRNLELGYSVPKQLLSRAGINKLRIYANVSNLFSLDNMKKYGIDPEIQATNAIAYPQQKLWNFGFNLTL